LHLLAIRGHRSSGQLVDRSAPRSRRSGADRGRRRAGRASTKPSAGSGRSSARTVIRGKTRGAPPSSRTTRRSATISATAPVLPLGRITPKTRKAASHPTSHKQHGDTRLRGPQTDRPAESHSHPRARCLVDPMPARCAPRPPSRRFSPLPSTFTTQSPSLIRPGRPPPKTIRRSPGPQLTPEQSVLTWPTWCRSLPSLFITNNGQTSGPCGMPWRMRAMRLPSRDHAGACSPVVVNRWRRPFG
jgi:hypothetical protein